MGRFGNQQIGLHYIVHKDKIPGGFWPLLHFDTAISGDHYMGFAKPLYVAVDAG
jgi:hypothetical protein